MGSSAAHVRDLYMEMGLDISDECRESPDHISVELEYMHFLCFREAEAAGRHDTEAALYFCRKQKEFIEGSLAWVHEFTDRIRAHAATEFYRGLAECTRAFIADHLAEIRSQEGEVPSNPRVPPP
jgi:TorA maturation chaperone TorD